DIPDKAAFVGNLGLKDTVEQAQNALDRRTGGTVNGSLQITHSVNVGDSDAGLIANGKGSVALYANNVSTPITSKPVSGIQSACIGYKTWKWVGNLPPVVERRLAKPSRSQLAAISRICCILMAGDKVGMSHAQVNAAITLIRAIP
ncbi:MAG: hypothetical protein ACMX3H_18775, partial [Sodalis sp. (in: enterobacteria)]